MSVDTYSVCPCGNGKKIKFCKCKDSIHDMDRVLKMVDGGQLVPALDQLASILEEHPDAAWALAIRGRLLIDLREYDSLAENSERFTRLQPSNPLALTQKAAAQLFKGDMDTATGTMLEALTESGREVDSFVLNVGSVLAYSLLQSGSFLTARAYATLAMMASGYEGGAAAMDVLNELNRAPTIPSLLKSLPKPIDRPASVEWGERYDEAQGLLRSNKIILAKTKFESLQRVAASQPSVLSGLLTCVIWSGDVDAQASIMRSLSECDSLSDTERSRYLAMSELVLADMPNLSVKMVEMTAEVEDAEETEMALTASSKILTLPSEVLAGLRQGEDEVPPKAAFQLLDRDKPDGDELPTATAMPRSQATMLLYGKQTDRAARLEVLDVFENVLDNVKSDLTSISSDLDLKNTGERPVPLVAAVQPQLPMLRFKASQAEADAVMAQVTDLELAKSIADAKVGLLGDKSLRETAGDDGIRLKRMAVAAVVDSYDALVSKVEDITSQVCEIAGLEGPQPITIPDDKVEEVANEDLNHLTLEGLNEESLVYLMQRAQQISATPLVRKSAAKILETEQATKEPQLGLVAHMALLSAATAPDEMVSQLDAARSFATKYELSAPRLLFADLQVRLRVGDSAGFQNTVNEIVSTHGNDPEIMGQLQQQLMSWGLIRPDGSPAGGPSPSPAPAAESGGELWTPESGNPAPSQASGGGGKLWVPGMD